MYKPQRSYYMNALVMIAIKTIKKMVSKNKDSFYCIKRNVYFTFLKHEEKKLPLIRVTFFNEV